MKRRDALKTIGGLGAAAGMSRLLPACGGSSGITTYVFMMMENRSYDHLLGARSMLEGKPGDGLVAGMSNLDGTGKKIDLWPAGRDDLCDRDPPHGWTSGRAQWNDGKNDGFVTAQEREHGAGAIEPMQYLTRTHVPVTWALADKYATADRWFCSVMGPTWPNRFYWHSATSGGLMSNVLPPDGIEWPTIYHRLSAKGVDWAYYYANIPVIATFEGVDKSKIRRFRRFAADAAEGTLPPVVYIDPGFYENDDHPPIHPIHGQELIAAVYNALATSPQWQHCMLVVTYDEHGGFFDHVPPPKTADDYAAMGFDQMGFRVPTLVAGPYVKEGHVSSVVHDHCSALRHLELAFDLEPLNQRTRAANDLSDFIDADRLSRGDWREPIELPVVNPSEWPMPAACVPPPSAVSPHPVVEWFDANAQRKRIADLDLRGEIADYRQAVRSLASGPRTRVR